MDAAPPPEQPDLSLLLPRSTYWHVVHTLLGSLPDPVPNTQEARTHRDRAAIADIASMLPANAEEARLAARCVLADAWSMECLRFARLHSADFPIVKQATAQSATLMRRADAARALLARLQATRNKREANAEARTQDAWTEHAALGLMAEALGDAAPEPPPPPAPEPDPEPAAASEFGALSEADQYAVTYPQRAAEIRARGGLPQPCRYGPPSAELVQAIVSGTSPILLALDKQR